MYAYHLINRLTVIVGHCELQMEDARPEDTRVLTRLALIRNIARSLAEELGNRQSEHQGDH